MHHYVDARPDRKERGAFFTPAALADFISSWAVRTPGDTVLEPSCGEAVFLVGAGRRLRLLGCRQPQDQLTGVDLHRDSLRRAAQVLSGEGLAPRLIAQDFFTFCEPASVDAVIGNPPYIRYQDFTGPVRARARRAALAHGVRLSALASSWAAFTVHAASFLRPGGRMGLVLPAELLSVNYAAPVRTFLMSRFSSIRLVLFTQRVFPDVQEEVVLLLAEGACPQGRGTDHFEVVQVDTAADLGATLAFAPWRPRSASHKWTGAIGGSQAYESLTASGAWTTLGAWGRLALGTVTGANSFFTLSPQRSAELGLTAQDTVAVSPPGSQHLRALTLTGAT